MPKKSGKILSLHQPVIQSHYDIDWFVSVGDVISQTENIASLDQVAGIVMMHHKDYDVLYKDFNIVKNFSVMDVERLDN